MKRIKLSLGIIAFILSISAQKNPTPFGLVAGDYIFDGFSVSDNVNYPLGMSGWAVDDVALVVQPGVPPPTDLQATLDMPLEVYDGENVGTVTNNELSGMGILSTGVGALSGGGPFPIAIVLALNTEGVTGINFRWTGRNVRNARGGVAGIQLQYRIGIVGNWTNMDGHRHSTTPDAPSDSGNPPAVFNSPETTLPDSLEGLPVVQFRWLFMLEDESLQIGDRIAVDSLRITTAEKEEQVAPIANFGFDVKGISVSFIDSSLNGPYSSYLWDFGDGASSNLPNPNHVFSEYKNYDVSLTVTNNAGSDTKTQSVTISQFPAFIESNIELEMNLYPNPSNGIVYFDILGKYKSNEVSAKVYDLTGRKVIENKLSSSNSLDISSLPSGVYSVKLKSNFQHLGNTSFIKE
jgi:PKD repeat protein